MKIGYKIIEIPLISTPDADDTVNVKFELNYGSEFKKLLGYYIQLPEFFMAIKPVVAKEEIANIFLAINSHKDILVINEPAKFQRTIDFFTIGKKKEFNPINEKLFSNSLITGRVKFIQNTAVYPVTGYPYDFAINAGDMIVDDLKLKIYLKLEKR